MEAMHQITVGGRTFTALFPDLLRPLLYDEMLDLRASIRQDGVRSPVLVDEAGGVIDGLNRLAIASDLGLASVPVVVLPGLDAATKERLALELNVSRRQLSPEQVRAARQRRVERVAELRAAGKTTREIAAEVGVSQPQVLKDIKDAGSIDNRLSMPDRIQTSDGRTYPARRPTPESVPEEDDQPDLPFGGDPSEDEADWESEEDDCEDGDEDGAEAAICPTCHRPVGSCRCDDLLAEAKAERAERREAGRRAELERLAEQAPPSDAWELRLGDSLELLQDVECGTVRLVFADPPYNIGWDYGDADGGNADDLHPAEYVAWCRVWMGLVREVLAPDGSFWLLINDEYVAELKLAAEKVGFFLRQWLVWYEAFGVNCQSKFNRCHRHLLWFVNDPNNFFFDADAPQVRRASDRQAKYDDSRAAPGGKLWDSVWGINPPIPRVAGTHAEAIPGSPAPQLPLALLTPILACASELGDLVLDPFCGNATTGAAALTLGRRFLGFELREPIYRLAELRLRAVVGSQRKE